MAHNLLAADVNFDDLSVSAIKVGILVTSWSQTVPITMNTC